MFPFSSLAVPATLQVEPHSEVASLRHLSHPFKMDGHVIDPEEILSIVKETVLSHNLREDLNTALTEVEALLASDLNNAQLQEELLEARLDALLSLTEEPSCNIEFIILASKLTVASCTDLAEAPEERLDRLSNLRGEITASLLECNRNLDASTFYSNFSLDDQPADVRDYSTLVKIHGDQLPPIDFLKIFFAGPLRRVVFAFDSKSKISKARRTRKELRADFFRELVATVKAGHGVLRHNISSLSELKMPELQNSLKNLGFRCSFSQNGTHEIVAEYLSPGKYLDELFAPREYTPQSCRLSREREDLIPT